MAGVLVSRRQPGSVAYPVNDAKPSKSARKREVIALQQLGERLIDLSEQQLRAIGTDPELVEHVLEAQRIRSHGALRRQKQLIGKIMRRVDAGPIRETLALLDRQAGSEKQLFRATERWRDKLLQGEVSLDEFESETGTSVETLRTLLQQAQSARGERATKSASRQLFREIHRLLARG